MVQHEAEVPTLENNIACAINDWYGPGPIVVSDVLNALIGTIASIAVQGGCTTIERREIMAEHLKTNVLAALQFYQNEMDATH